jgi:cytochrome c553
LSCVRISRRRMRLPQVTLRIARLAGILGLGVLLPSETDAVSTSQQELQAVEHSTPDLDQGAQVFHTCAMCHGRDGGGTPDGQVPRIAAQHASVLRKQLIDYRYDRRWDLRMESITGRHDLPTPQAIADVTAYVSRLDREPSISTGDGSLVQRGAASYAHRCRGCHGTAAQGDGGRAIPRLAGQHYEYLRRQIYDAVDGRRPNFSSEHIRLLAQLDHDDIQGLADYLSRLGSGAAPVAPATERATGPATPRAGQ